MLRLKKAIDDCGIQQKAICEATGFGKTQVSLTLNSGKLPADAERFKAGVDELVHTEPALYQWLATRNLNVERLFEDIGEVVPKGLKDNDLTAEELTETPAATLDFHLNALAGKAYVDQGLTTDDLARLIRTTKFLAEQARYYAGFAAPAALVEAIRILAGIDRS